MRTVRTCVTALAGAILLSLTAGAFCLSDPQRQAAQPAVSDQQEWPQWMGPHRQERFADPNQVQSFDDGDLPVAWRTPVKMGYAGPAVADGRVYLMDWELTREQQQAKEPGTERLLCLDEATGDVIWEKAYPKVYRISYPFGPRTTCAVDGERVYALGAMGDLWCLNVADGSEIWSVDFLEDYAEKPPFWGYAAHPFIDGDQLICVVGGQGSALVSFDKRTGQVLWKTHTAKDVGYAPPVIAEHGEQRQLIFWHDFGVVSVDPDNGQVKWTESYADPAKAQGPAVTIATPLVHDNKLLIGDFYSGSTVWDLTETWEGGQPKIVWQDDPDDEKHEQGLNSLMGSPIVRDGLLFGVSGMGEFRCLDFATGEILWRTHQPVTGEEAVFGTAFLIPSHDNRCWIFNDQGELILAELNREGYRELGRQKILEPMSRARGRTVVWSHPAFANGHLFARNDAELVKVRLTEVEPTGDVDSPTRP